MQKPKKHCIAGGIVVFCAAKIGPKQGGFVFVLIPVPQNENYFNKPKTDKDVRRRIFNIFNYLLYLPPWIFFRAVYEPTE